MASVQNRTASDFVVGRMLKGSDLGKNPTVKVVIESVRSTPASWGSPFVLDIKEVLGCENMALNKTNAKKLADLIDDETDNWVGYSVTFGKELVDNPSTNSKVYGLVVLSVEAPTLGGRKKR
jgi:altronate dehydratase